MEESMEGRLGVMGAGGSWKQKESFSLPGAFKTYAHLWEGKNLVTPNQ
jgi:hypothetical protein